MSSVFNHSSLLARSWHAVLSSSQLKRGAARSVDFSDRKIALFRDHSGAIGALDAFCPHMGADLGSGKVRDGALVCPYHHWAFGTSGECLRVRAQSTAESKQRSTFAYPVCERYGYIWIFNGERAAFPAPSTEWSETDHHLIRLPPHRIRCHPHAIGTNVADFNHLETLHGFVFQGKPELVKECDYQLEHRYRIALQSKNWVDRLFALFAGRVFDFKVTIYGDNNVLMDVSSRNYSLMSLITVSPSVEGHSIGRTILFVPKGRGIVRLLRLNLLKVPLLLASFVKVQFEDLRLFERMRFSPKPTDSDASVVRYMKLVEKLGAFHPTNPGRTTSCEVK